METEAGLAAASAQLGHAVRELGGGSAVTAKYYIGRKERPVVANLEILAHLLGPNVANKSGD